MAHYGAVRRRDVAPAQTGASPSKILPGAACPVAVRRKRSRSKALRRQQGIYPEGVTAEFPPDGLCSPTNLSLSSISLAESEKMDRRGWPAEGRDG
jgi:hypothetical protein